MEWSRDGRDYQEDAAVAAAGDDGDIRVDVWGRRGGRSSCCRLCKRCCSAVSARV